MSPSAVGTRDAMYYYYSTATGKTYDLKLLKKVSDMPANLVIQSLSITVQGKQKQQASIKANLE